MKGLLQRILQQPFSTSASMRAFCIFLYLLNKRRNRENIGSTKRCFTRKIAKSSAATCERLQRSQTHFLIHFPTGSIKACPFCDRSLRRRSFFRILYPKMPLHKPPYREDHEEILNHHRTKEPVYRTMGYVSGLHHGKQLKKTL